MSSMSLTNSRKRLHSPDLRDSDDSESDEEVPPFKLRKKYEHRIPLAFKEKLQNLVVWISDLPVKNFFTMAIKSGSNLQQGIVLDDDDDDDEVIVEEVKKPDPDKIIPLIKKLEQCQKISSSDKKPLKRNGSYGISSCYESHRANGSSSRNWNSLYSRNDYSKDRKTGNLRRSAVVSNPSTDIEIVLGTKPKVSPQETDEIEIVSELPSAKEKHVSSKKTFHLSRNFVSSTSSSQHSSAKRSQKSPSKDFTANKVVRLQEKAQYKLLLEKVMSGSYNVAKKPELVDTKVQADSKCYGNHFKKETLAQPLGDTIEKYFKPCALLPYYKDGKNKNKTDKPPPEIKIDDDDDDEEIKIIEVKLPTCKPKFLTGRAFTHEWLTELKDSVRAQTKERIKIVEDQERLLEGFRKERLLNRLKVDSVDPEFPGLRTTTDLKTRENAIHSRNETERNFTKLTPEMEKVIDDAYSVLNFEETLSKISGTAIARKDIETLSGANWLNDLVISLYMDLLLERSTQEGYPSLYAFNTFFYTNLKTRGYHPVKRWTRKIDIFSYDLNFVPIHLAVHWCLGVIDHRSKRICYYDSMGSGEEICLEYLLDYLAQEYADKKGGYFDRSSYTKEIMKDIPAQQNGSDCGMFTLKYAEYISRDAEITFTQAHMDYFRRRTVYELLKGKLLT